MNKLVAVLVVAFAVFIAGPSEAGCALTVTFSNEFDRAIQVHEVDSKTLPVGKYAQVWSGSITVPAGEKRSVAVELKLGCAAEGGTRMLRAKYTKGTESGWKTKGPVNTALDRKIKIRFK